MDYGQVIYDTAINAGFSEILANILLSQAQHETNNFTSDVFKENNNAFGYKYVGSKFQEKEKGILSPEGNTYGKYSSVEKSALETINWVKRNVSDYKSIATPEEYASALKNGKVGSYYSDDLKNYQQGLKNFFVKNQAGAVKKDKSKISINGDASTQPDKNASLKKSKEKILADVKSGIISKATPETSAKTAVEKCPLLESNQQTVPKKNEATREAKVQCNLSGLSVTKSGGTYTLNVNAIPNACTEGKLEIVAGYNKRVAKMNCIVLGPAGPCEEIHKTKVFDFTDQSTGKTDNKLDFDAASVYAFNFFPAKPATHTYTLSANTCGASAGAVIRVYPDTIWHIKVTTTFKGKELDEIKIEGDYAEDQNSLTFSASSNGEIEVDFKNDSTHAGFEKSEDSFKAGYKDENTTVGISASGEHVESYYDDKSTKTTSHVSTDINALDSDGAVKGVKINDMSIQSGDVKLQINERLKNNINLLYKTISIIKFIKGLIDIFTESGASPVTFELKWPNIEVDGNWQWKEIEGTPKCGFEYDVSGGLHPLIGCEVDVDLVGAILLSIPGYGPILHKILHAIEYVSGDELEVKLTLTGELISDFSVKKPANAADPIINMPDAHVDIILELSATLQLKKHNFILGYGGGGKGSAKIVITLHKPIIQNSGIDLPCDYQFTGITISSIEYVKESSDWKDRLPDEEDEMVEIETERGHWLEGESHAFLIPLI
jgi:hypothetical protein